MNRRQFNQLACLTATVPLLNACTPAASAVKPKPASRLDARQAKEQSLKAHQTFMADKNVKMHGKEQIAMLMYPGFTALDLIGPHYLFTSMMGADVYLLSANDDLQPIKCDNGLQLLPSHTHSQCPEHLDLLFLPGSATGVLKALQNTQFIEFIRQKAKTSRYLTSVCTGSLLLGKAGLLQGKRATSHWVAVDLLAKVGAIPTHERVVWDGNVITGAGVTAGIDFALQIVALLRGKTYAEALQLQIEYAPQPPFSSGTPEQASALVKESLQGMFAPLLVELEQAL